MRGRNLVLTAIAQSRGGTAKAIPHFVRLDFAHATQSVLHAMADRHGLRNRGVQQEAPLSVPDVSGL